MAPTFIPGDTVFVNKLAFALEPPARGDLVLFRARQLGNEVIPFDRSADGDRAQYVMRVLAIPGDTIEFHGGIATLNGLPLAEKRLRRIWRDSHGEEHSVIREWIDGRAHLISRSDFLGRDFQTLTVEPGRYFVVGDARSVSLDSRYWGTIRREDILGRPTVIYFASKLDRIGRTPQ
jgi:signal peptidase I